MKNLIEFQKEIKEWDIEKILDKLVSEGYWYRVTSNEEVKKEHEGKICY